MRPLRSLLLAAPLALSIALAACSSSSDGSSSATTTPSGSTTAAGSTTIAGSTTVPGSTTPAGPATSVPLALFIAQLYSSGFGVQVTPEEASCLAGQIGTTHLSELQAYVGGGAQPSDEAKQQTMAALVHCEPSKFVQQAVTNITQNTGATADQATCAVKAIDDLAEADKEILALATSGQATAQWPDAAKAKFISAVSPSCVTAEVAQKLLNG